MFIHGAINISVPSRAEATMAIETDILFTLVLSDVKFNICIDIIQFISKIKART